MTWYRAELKPLSSFVTPLQSDTLWGHLMIMERDEARREGMITSSLAGDPPFLVSAGFPAGFLPLPPPVTVQDEDLQVLAKELYPDGVSSLARIKSIKNTIKSLCKKSFVRYKGFSELNEAVWSPMARIKHFINYPESYLPGNDDVIHTADVMHTAVNRRSSAALEGHLYDRPELFFTGGIDVFFQIRETAYKSRIELLLNALQQNGYGARTTIGKGRFEWPGKLIEETRSIFFDTSGSSDSDTKEWLSLSSFTPVAGQIASYMSPKAIIKRGRLGNWLPDMAAFSHPWKKPLLMLPPGTVFQKETADLVGQAIPGLAVHFEDAVQFAYAAAISFKRYHTLDLSQERI